MITHEGERGARVLAFFVITEGTAAVSVNGERKATLGPGDYFGEIGLFHDIPRIATVTTETELACLAMGAWQFRPFVRSTQALPGSSSRRCRSGWPSRFHPAEAA